MKTNRLFIVGTLFVLAVFSAACGGGATGGTAKTVAEKKISDKLTVAIMSEDGKLKNGSQQITLKFTDNQGNPVEMKAASLNFNMPAMGSMAEMNDSANLSTTDTTGEFKGDLKLQMAGDWTAQIAYEGVETGKTTIAVTAN